jgi:hypothetical protein
MDPLNPSRYRGSPSEIGRAQGIHLRPVLAARYEEYLRRFTATGLLDIERVRRDALAWHDALPARYREETAAIAEGAGVSLETMAECQFASYAVTGDPVRACTTIVTSIEGRTWIAHNNDWFDCGSRAWAAAVVREIPGRRSTLIFGLEGDVCGVVGVNEDRLWIQLNGFPAHDAPRTGLPFMPSPFLAREALETCGSLDDLERLLRGCDRTDGMAFYAVDGKTEEFAVFECTRTVVVRRDSTAGSVLASCTRDLELRVLRDGRRAIIGTNLHRRMDRLRRLWAHVELTAMPADLIAMLADSQIEDVGEDSGTLYSNVACPSLGLGWFAAGEVPAPSRSEWRSIAWPFPAGMLRMG